MWVAQQSTWNDASWKELSSLSTPAHWIKGEKDGGRECPAGKAGVRGGGENSKAVAKQGVLFAEH